MLDVLKKKNGALDLFAILFSVFWIVILLLDYFNKHAVYVDSLVHFKFVKLSLFLIFYGVLFTSILNYKKGLVLKFRPYLFTPLVIISFFLCLLVMAISYSKYYLFKMDSLSYFHFLLNAGTILLGGFSILFACYSLGNLISHRLLNKKVIAKSHFTLDIALGIMLFTFILFPLAWFHLLGAEVLAGILLISIGLNYKTALNGWKTMISLQPNFNPYQNAILYLIGIFAIFNFAYVISPYPLGFDSRNNYVNLSQLIAHNNGFVKGFQPHNWELFMAVGKVLFGKIEISMFLSYVGGILAAFALYNFSNNIVKLSKTISLLITLIFITTPAISHQMYVEFKVDLGLLYFQIVTVALFFSHMVYKNVKPKFEWIYAVITGLLLGFGIGIKLLNFFLIYGLFCAIAIDRKNNYSAFSAIFLGLGIILFLKIDQMTGLRKFHEYADILCYSLLLAGAICAIYSFYKNFEKTKKVYIQMAVIGIVSISCFTPWVYKSYCDTGSANVMRLIRGISPGHIIDYKIMDEKNKEVQKVK